MWSNREKGILFFTLGMILGFLIMGRCSDANAADRTIVSFRDAEHLAALRDSVVGVCDTTWWVITSTIELPNGCVVDSAFVSVVLDDSIIVDSAKIYPYDITCRRLVGVTVVEPVTVAWRLDYVATERNDLTTYIPLKSSGEAIIFYEEVKCIK